VLQRRSHPVENLCGHRFSRDPSLSVRFVYERHAFSLGALSAAGFHPPLNGAQAIVADDRAHVLDDRHDDVERAIHGAAVEMLDPRMVFQVALRLERALRAAGAAAHRARERFYRDGCGMHNQYDISVGGQREATKSR
jgi:hypothetical protein